MDFETWKRKDLTINLRHIMDFGKEEFEGSNFKYRTDGSYHERICGDCRRYV